MQKNFDDWNRLKQRLDSKKERIFFFKERDIWWCSLGINIGDEENGKNEFFTRPVLVIRKFNRNIFLGIPLSSKIKDNKYYHKFSLNEKEGSIMLSQLRVMESKRMQRRMGELSNKQFDEVKRKIIRIIEGRF